MKEIKDKKIYKTVSMVGSRYTYLEVFDLVQRWENRFGDRIIVGENVPEEVLDSMRADADDFYAATCFDREKVNIEFYGAATLSFRATVRVYENKQLRYWLTIKPISRVYVKDDEEEGGEE